MPSLSLPKGGGAIKGMGEKFGVNPATGTGTLTIPIPLSPGRGGFAPQLSLAYDSGSGNGPFGFGWTLATPAITRKTDKGLPQYRDAEESDVFLIAGAEDLVPVLLPDGSRHEDGVTFPGFTVHRYRPRVEGLFARIERWTSDDTGDVHWRSISKENVTTIYGRDERSRIFDPADPSRIFSWLICESHDDKGNAFVCEYAAEDDADVDQSQVHERNRVRTANRYPKRVFYGNRVSRLIEPDPADADWLFEVVFDYDEGHAEASPLDPSFVRASSSGRTWTARPDPFSSYRGGFEVRTYRRCHRVLVFHRFPELGADPYLVRALDFEYIDLDYSFIRAITNRGYVRDEAQPVVEIDGIRYFTYLEKSLPPLELEYSAATIEDAVRDLDPRSSENVPIGIDGTSYLFVDLNGEGLPGILTEQADAWFYKPNFGGGELGPIRKIAPMPAMAALAGKQQQLLDLDGDGHIDLVAFGGPVPGFYERSEDDGWESFRTFRSLPNIEWSDPNLRFVDLDGDGHADALLTEDDVFTWYPSLEEEGFGAARQVRPPADEERGARVLFADGTQSVYLADMCGDGLSDMVRIRNGEVCYWPNLGYGRFGAKVTMDDAPWLDHPDQFDQRRVRLADVDGSGTNDILYIGRDGVRLYFNRSGNRWSDARPLAVLPRVDDLSSITTADLFGNGTACLVWSSPLASDAHHPLRYVDLMGGNKPYLLLRAANNLGAETRVHYAASTKFYLDDRRAGRPWLTRIPFPVHVVERVETFDRISRNRFVTRYAYHHGAFDGEEREFRGFAFVEQWDTEEFATLSASDEFPTGANIDAASHVPPVLTKTWFHTGSSVARDLARDFYREPGADLLDVSVLPDDLTAEEERQAFRALKGSTLRTETYALDGSDREAIPYSVSAQNHAVRRLQPRGENRWAVFLTFGRESLAWHYERVLPHDPRAAHTFTLEVDDFGNVLQSVAVGYGRRTPDMTLPTPADRDRQAEIRVTYNLDHFTNDVETANDHHAPLGSESRMYELTGLALPAGQQRFTFDQIVNAAANAARRLIRHTRTYYRDDNLIGALPLHDLQSRALPFETDKLAFTPQLVTDIYGARVDEAMLEGEGRYVHTRDENGVLDANWWVPAGRIFYSPDPAHTPAQELAYARAHFFVPLRLRDPFQHESEIDYDAHDVLPVESRDAVGNRVTAAELDYRVLQPRVLMDANRNGTAVAFDALGMVVGTAAMGKPLPAPPVGDSLAGFVADLTDAEVAAHLADPFADALALLQNAGTRIVIDAFAYYRTRDLPEPRPMAVGTITRQTHGGAEVLHSFSYSDGFGREIQKKVQAEEGRWVGSGWTIFNNKGKPVRTFEPFFTDTHRFELDVAVGVSPIVFYDPTQRVVATLHPDHTWQKTVFDPWRSETWDTSDTVLIADPRTDAHVGDFFARLPDADYLPTWHAQRAGGALGASEQTAAARTAVHAATPTVAHVDSLGRTCLAIAHNRFKYSNTPPLDPPVTQLYERRAVHDIEGNEREIVDANGRLTMRYAYDMLGNRLTAESMEAGTRWTLNDVAGEPIRNFDTIGHTTRNEYDPLRRPVRTFLTVPGDPVERMTDLLVYGEQHPDAELLNLLGAIYLRFDQAGVARNEEHDFKGNLLRSSRRIAIEFAQTVDWSAVDAVLPAGATAVFDPLALEAAIAPLVENDVYTDETSYDALNRPTQQITPDGTVFTFFYNEANKLDRVDANLRGVPEITPFVTDLDYDAKGQRTFIAYGNGAETAYEYDPLTFRLRHLQTIGNDGTLQDLRYTYDPSGNVTHIRDDAQQAIFFANHHIDPSADYTYDALSRLIEATGREHLGQIGGAPVPHSPDDAPRVGIPWANNDGNAMGAYLERYLYDFTGNVLEMQHRGTDPLHPGWTRSYAYGEPNNRLTSTTVGANPIERYVYDLHGNMIRMPHFGGAHPAPNMSWDSRNQLHSIDLGGGGTVHYVYDSSRRRTRKVWQKTPNLIEERIYLGAFELFRRRNGAGAITFARETLHIMDDARRMAMVETRTVDVAGNDPAPEQLIRYQFGNHLESSSLELDGAGQIITYEEYTPYGSTAYQAVRNQTATPKRFRYSGVERDEESGLGYHGARYYAPWLGRWTATDPAGLVDGDNLYRYSRNNPVRFNDPGGMDPPPGQYSQGDFRTSFATNPISDPASHAGYLDLIFPGLIGLAFNGIDLGNRTDSPGGRIALNATEFVATFFLFYGPMVASHEGGGHLGTLLRYGQSGTITSFTWFSGTTSPPAAGTPTNQQIAYRAAGGNQQVLNAGATYDRAARFGYFSPADALWYLLGQAGTQWYSYITLATGAPPGRNDIASYASFGSPRWGAGGIAAASTVTALPAYIAAGYSAWQFIVNNQRRVEFPSASIGSARLTFPNLQTLLTSSGTVLGASTVLALAPGQEWFGGTSFQFGLDVLPTSNFAVGISARSSGFHIGSTPLQFNPYFRATIAGTPGFYGGAELGLDVGRLFGQPNALTVTGSLEGGVNDIRAEPEGLPALQGQGWGGRGRIDAILRW